MSDTAIVVENLGKRFEIGGALRHTNIREQFASRVSALFGRASGYPATSRERPSIWALDGVSFDVKKGEAVGIIGRNGAGKSTLLKILSRITSPSRGSVTLEGRVGSLLEVGTGFHSELSGRENIFLNGAILGMRRAEIVRKFNEIVAFSEVGQFIDTPVKRYSSGMYMRLAFAVAAHLETEILIVDEVLAVGDAAFQQKCLGKMGDAAKGGRTVLFVSHSMESVLRLCKTAVLLERGQMVANGPVNTVVDQYLRRATATEPIARLADAKRPSPQRGRATLMSARLLSSAPAGPWHIQFSDSVILEVAVRVTDELPWLELGVAILSRTGFEITSSLSSMDLPPSPFAPGEYVFTVEFKRLWLTTGLYRFDFGLRSDRGMEDYLPNAADLEVVPSEQSARQNVQSLQGAIVPDASYSVRPVINAFAGDMKG